jgi:hypothetical protein
MNILGHALLRAFDERAACIDLSDHMIGGEGYCEFVPE